MKKTLLNAAATALVGAAALASPAAQAADPLPVAFVYLGNPGDAGWTFAHDLGAKAVEAKFGSAVKITKIENVPESADSERVIRDLASKGNKVIIATSFGYQDFELKVAKDFPDTIFLHATGFKTAPNFGTYNVRMEQVAYLAGVAAGYASKTGTLGFVASVPIPEVVRNIDAYTLGAQSVNPKIKTKVVWVNSWFDPGKEKQAAESLIGQGADVLMQNTDSTATLTTAQEKGVYAFGWDSNMQKFGPKAHLGSVVGKWGVYYTAVIQQILDKKWTNAPIWWGLPEGAIDVEDINTTALSAKAVKDVADRKAAIAAGKLDVFSGPVKGQDGSIKIAAGKSLNDAELTGLMWYVQGVEGSLPK